MRQETLIEPNMEIERRVARLQAENQFPVRATQTKPNLTSLIKQLE